MGIYLNQPMTDQLKIIYNKRDADLKKLREADTKVVFSKPIRQDPNRGMHFIKNLSSINQGKLGYSRTFLKGIKVETYY